MGETLDEIVNQVLQKSTANIPRHQHSAHYFQGIATIKAAMIQAAAIDRLARAIEDKK